MTRNALLFSLLALLVPPLLLAQPAGLLTSDERYQALPLLPSYSGVKYTEVPVRVSLKKYCPVPGNQGQSGACVGWALGYGALTIQRAIASQVTDQARITQQAHSAAFLYNQLRQDKADCTEGAYLEDGLALLQSQGDCLERSFNFEQQGCRAQPEAAHLAEAGQHRRQDFAAVFALNEDPKNKIGKACKILATNTPLVVGMGITQSFLDVLPGATVWNPAESETVTGYHAMVLVGYNNVDKYFDLINSFGPSWGQNGFIRLAFDDFERLCRYAYVIVPGSAVVAKTDSNTAASDSARQQPSLPVTRPLLGGEFVFRQPAGFVTNEAGEELMYFEEISARREATAPGLYTTERAAFQVGDVFQLVAREIPRGRYVYVFSQGPDGVLNQHFPRKKDAAASAGFVLERTVEIVIPGEESLLQLSLPGHDHLCILYSHALVPNFEQRLRQIESGDQAFSDKVQAAFADVLIAAPDVQFSAQKMSFTALADPKAGKIAAVIILRVKAE